MNSIGSKGQLNSSIQGSASKPRSSSKGSNRSGQSPTFKHQTRPNKKDDGGIKPFTGRTKVAPKNEAVASLTTILSNENRVSNGLEKLRDSLTNPYIRKTRAER